MLGRFVRICRKNFGCGSGKGNDWGNGVAVPGVIPGVIEVSEVK
jgi:hypothetical protein